MGCWTSGSGGEDFHLEPGRQRSLGASFLRAQAGEEHHVSGRRRAVGGGQGWREIYREQSDGEEDVGAFHRLDDGFKAGEFSQ